MRFGLLDQLNLHPVLVFANALAEVFFWDFVRLEEGHGGPKDQSRQRGLTRDGSSVRSESVTTTSASISFESPSASGTRSLVKDRKKYDISNPWKGIKAHQRIEIPRVHFQGRQVSWSSDGKWLLVVGDSGDDGLIAVFNRWENGN